MSFQLGRREKFLKIFLFARAFNSSDMQKQRFLFTQEQAEWNVVFIYTAW